MLVDVLSVCPCPDIFRLQQAVRYSIEVFICHIMPIITSGYVRYGGRGRVHRVLAGCITMTYTDVTICCKFGH